MKPRKSAASCRSFDELKALLDHKFDSLPVTPEPPPKQEEAEQEPEPEEILFAKAMEGVSPIGRGTYVERICQANLPEGTREREDSEVLARLVELVESGKGFHVSDTPEYIEGTGYQVNPAVARRLHQGGYSIQAHVDLHGYNVEEARELFEKFLRWALFTNKKGVLIVHGRGLCSPAEPVLKRKVEEWLTRGPFRKWVVAYSSARICDGGAGATYVLLRERPASRRMRARKPKTRESRS